MGISGLFLVIFVIGIIASFSINDAFAEKTIFDDATGGDCSSIGTWDAGTKTCTLTNNISDGIVIGSNNIILDGAGFSVLGLGGESENYGIFMNVRTGVTIKNVKVDNFYIGIQLRDSFSNTISDNIVQNIRFEGIRLDSFSYNNLISNNQVTQNQGHGISVSNSDNNEIRGNTVTKNKVGISVFASSGGKIIDNVVRLNTEDGMEISTENISIENNIISDNVVSGNGYGIRAITGSNLSILHNEISNNKRGIVIAAYSSTITENTIKNNSEKGLRNDRDSNEFYHNNFVNNGISATSAVTAIFSLSEPIGGNYWSDYSPTCTNTNQDNFCDDPYPFSGGTINVNDNFVWTIQDGWLTQIQTPGDITIEATDSTGSIVDFSVSATFDGNPISVTCDSSSGSTFPIGETIVLCTASTGIVSTFAVKVQDTTPPTVVVPSDISVETTNSSGEIVTFEVSATDNIDGEITPSCQPASGSTFVIGETEVTCTATDSSGNVGTASFSVILIDISEPEPDTIPPVIVIPNDMAVEATSSNGSVVTFSVSATDDVDGSVTVSCSHVSGSVFPIGSTTIICTATDSAGNSASKSFTITVSELQSELKIPDELRQVAKLWSQGQIDDSEFLQQVQIQINSGNMVIPGVDTGGSGGSTGSTSIPSWVRNNAGWWADGQISDSDFASGIEYLFSQGILPVTISEEPEPEPEQQISILTSRSSYNEGETIVISGKVSTIILDAPLTVQIFNLGNLIEIVQLVVAQDGSFTHTLVAQGPQWQNEGEYVVRASYGEGNIAETTFQFFKNDVEPEPTPTPQPEVTHVSVPSGTSVPGCEETNECFIPFSVSVARGGKVIWSNDDTAAHTVTSGSAADGANGIFDSSLFMAGQTFSVTFDQDGTFQYFCMVHPWMRGQVIVGEGGPVTIPEPQPEPEPTPIPTPTPVPSEGQVFNAPGSSVPGCEETNSCFIPFEIRIDVGDIVTWINDDTAAHTSTSGSPVDGPSDVFDSSLILAGSSFSFTFDESGIFPYFCMVHPWMQGVVVVGEGVFLPEPEPTPDITISVSTDKRLYDLGESVRIDAKISGINFAQQIGLTVTDPFGNSVVSRTLTTDSRGSASLDFKIPESFRTGAYQVTVTASIDGITYEDSTHFKIKSQFGQVSIISVQATDQQGNPSSFSKGTLGFVKVVVSADKRIATLITVNLFDSELTTIGIGSFQTTLSTGESEMILSFLIPDEAADGRAVIYANMFSDWPSNGGTLLTEESAAGVEIR